MNVWSIGGGGRGQSVMELIWCNGLPEIHAQLTGGPSAKVGLSAKCELIYVSCFGVVVLYGELGEGQGSVCHKN